MTLKTRKILFVIAAFFSLISALLPFFIVTHQGMTVNGFPVTDDTTISLSHCYYGLGILLTAALAAIFALSGKRIGYAVSTVTNVIFSIWGFFDMMNYKVTDNGIIDISGAYYSALSGLKYNTIIEVKNGAGFYLLIFSVVFLLVMMLINFAKGED